MKVQNLPYPLLRGQPLNSESRRAHQWRSFALQYRLTHAILSDLTTSAKSSTSRPPLRIGPVRVFLLILSGLKFQIKEKILLLTSFTYSTGRFNTEQL